MRKLYLTNWGHVGQIEFLWFNEVQIGDSHRFSIPYGTYKTKCPVSMHVTDLCECEITIRPEPIGNTTAHLDYCNGSQFGILQLKYPHSTPLRDDLAPYGIIAVA